MTLRTYQDRAKQRRSTEGALVAHLHPMAQFAQAVAQPAELIKRQLTSCYPFVQVESAWLTGIL